MNFRAFFALAASLAACGCSESIIDTANADALSFVGKDLPPLGDQVSTATHELRWGTAQGIVRLSGLAVDDAGRFIVTDVSEGNVRVFDKTGKSTISFGSRGDGPGEFRTPAFPMSDARLRIHITDLTHRAVEVFDSTGIFQRRVTFPSLGRIDQVALDRLERYWVVGNAIRSADQNVLFLCDSSGALIQSFLPLAQASPKGSKSSTNWASVRRPSIAIGDSSAFVVHTLLDTIWTIHLDTLGITASALHHPAFTPAKAAASVPRSSAQLRAWIESLLLVSNVVAYGDGALVGYARGLYAEQSDTFVSLVRADGSQEQFARTPPFIGGTRNRAFGLVALSDSSVRLREFSVKLK